MTSRARAIAIAAMGLALASCSSVPASPPRDPGLEAIWSQCSARLARPGTATRASALHARFFGADRIDCGAYRRYFERRIRRIEKEGWGFASCHGAIACTDASGVLRLSSRFEDPGIPWAVKLSLLLHEARHAEGWAHVECPADRELRSPFQGADLRGTPQCDRDEWGALGIQYVWLAHSIRSDASREPRERQRTIDYSRFILQLVEPGARARLIEDNPS